MSILVHIAVIVGMSRPAFDALSGALKESGLVIVGRGLHQRDAQIDQSYLSEMFERMTETVQRNFARVTELRLSVWYYDYDDNNSWLGDMQELFFPFSCFVKIPKKYYNRPEHTANFARNTIASIRIGLSLISTEIAIKRTSSPFVLPMKNFRSKKLVPIYQKLMEIMPDEEIEHWLSEQKETFIREHRKRGAKKSGLPCLHDDRDYAFQPARPQEEEHWKTREAQEEICPENNIVCYLNCKLRFGATLKQGFHYNVQPARHTVEGNFFHCDGTPQNVTSGRYRYVNVFPNDYFKPMK